MKTYIILISSLIILFSCKKEEPALKQPTTPIVHTPSYDSITYKCYGGHTWYEVDYIERGIQYHVNPSGANRTWEHSFTDTVGSPKRLVYASSLDSDTMTALIIINGVTTDSIRVVGASMEVSLSRN